MSESVSDPIKEPPFGTAGGLYYPSDGAYKLAEFLGLDEAGRDALHTELRECYFRAKQEAEECGYEQGYQAGREEAQAWQPIETAPKTAERFHAWESYPEWPAPHGRVITAWWQAFGDDQGWQNDNVHAPVAGTLTHWMPLPTPPTEGSES